MTFGSGPVSQSLHYCSLHCGAKLTGLQKNYGQRGRVSSPRRKVKTVPGAVLDSFQDVLRQFEAL